MKNIELECIPSWRYCRIPYGQKGPRYANWQNTPLTIAQIPDGMNVGLLLGPTSGGIVALDFDGASAWRWFDDTFAIPIPETVSWASGRPGRCQMAFRLESEYWPYVDTQQIELDPIPDTDKFEGFELRWAGAQSVLPPSRHPDTGVDYFWVMPPSTTNIQPLPNAVLNWWVKKCLPRAAPEPEVVVKPNISQKEVDETVDLLKKLYPILNWKNWSTITWAVTNTIGWDAGITLMKYHWPEKEPGEYENLRGRARGEPVKYGTLRKMIQDRLPKPAQIEFKERNYE